MLKKIVFLGMMSVAMVVTGSNASEQTAYPGVSLATQSGYGLNGGMAFVGGGAIESVPNGSDISGALVTGVGFGDSKESVGFELDLVIASANPSDGGFGDDGFFNAKIHKTLSDLSSVSVGVENIGSWGGAKDDDESIYVAYSHIFLVPSPLIVTIGAGNGRFADAQADDSAGVFASVGYYITQQFSVIADYTADVTRAGVSFVPVAEWPISVTVYADDLTSKYDDTKFAMNAVYIINF